MNNTFLRNVFFCLAALATLLALAGCGSAPTTSAGQVQPTVTIPAGFQNSLSPIPTVPSYRCGAWTSNNAPNPGATITIYSRLTHNTQGVQGIAASAVVHFQSGDISLTTATSDAGGYVTFTLPLQGRQPTQVPATVDVMFTGTPGGSLQCTTFFTPH
jgi:hypothetical protein